MVVASKGATGSFSSQEVKSKTHDKRNTDAKKLKDFIIDLYDLVKHEFLLFLPGIRNTGIG
jgi:hypothetical protein